MPLADDPNTARSVAVSFFEAASIRAWVAASGESKVFCGICCRGSRGAGVCAKAVAPTATTKIIVNVFVVILPPASAATMEPAASATAASESSATTKSARAAHAGESVIALHTRHASALDSAKGAMAAAKAALRRREPSFRAAR